MTSRRTDPGYRNVGNRPTKGNRLTSEVTAVTEVTHLEGPAGADSRATLASLLAQIAQVIADERPAAPAAPAGVMPERVLLTPEEAGERLGIGRTTVYALIKCGVLESVQIGRLRRIPVGAIQDYAARLVEQSHNRTA
jgi:excisionase family DNA binding protein